MKKLLQTNCKALLCLVTMLSGMISYAQSVTTTTATEVQLTSATLTGTVTAQGQAVIPSFEYGTTTAYGTVVGATPLLVTEDDVQIEANIVSLEPNTLYYFRAFVTDTLTQNVIPGNEMFFTTPSAYVQAVPVALPATDVLHTSFVAQWTGASLATGYRLDVSTSEDFSTFLQGYENREVLGTSQIVTGPEVLANSTFYYRVRAYNEEYNETSANSLTMDVTTANPFIWNGTAWSQNGFPGIEDDVILENDYNVAIDNLSSSTPEILTAKSIKVTGGTFTISSGTQVVINNELQVEGGAVIIENNGNLIQTVPNAENTGEVTVLRTNGGLYRSDYSLWSSPVTGQNLLNFSPETSLHRFYKYNTLQDIYLSSIDGAVDPAGEDFETGKGYLIRMPNSLPDIEGYNEGLTLTEFTGQYTGAVHNGNITVNLSDEGQGYNAVGNPYPSSINAYTFLNTYAVGENAIIDGTLYFWRKKNALPGDFYATFTSAGGVAATGNAEGGDVITDVPNGNIQTGQGFIVRVLPGKGGNQVLFDNGLRQHDETGLFFRNGSIAEPEKHRMWFNFITPEGLKYQSLVAYMEGATNGFDNAIDGKRFSTANDGFYSVIDNGQYAIQGRSLPFTAQDEVPMAYKAKTAGSYSITLAETDGLFAQGQDIFIKDNVTGTLHNIKAGTYTFVTEAGTFNDRFIIVYTDAPAMGTTDNTFTANNVVVYKQGTTLTINTGKVSMTDVTIYDIQGRAVYAKNGINATEAVITDLQSQQQVLIVQITTPQGKVSKKVVY